MIPILIIGGLALLYFVVEARQTPSSGVTVGVSPGAVSTQEGIAEETSTDTEISSGITSTASALGIPLVGTIATLFTSAHASAVAKEAQTLNQATPTFVNLVEQTMAALNQGTITPAQAISYLQEAQSDYYTTVAGIIKKGGACRKPSLAAQSSGANVQTMMQYAKGTGCNGAVNCCIYTEDWADCASTGDCNASCAIGCGLVEPTVSFLTAIINAGGGTFTIPESADNGAIQGTAAVTITYTPYKPTVVSTGLKSLSSLF